MKRPQQNNQRGFSLIEMLVIVGMIGILTTIIVVRLAGTTDPIELQNASSIVRSDISATLTWAQTGRIEQTSGELPAGYGIIFYMDSARYDMYADIDADNRYTPENDTVVQTIELTQDENIQNVVFSDCAPVETANGDTICDVLFQQPSARVYINGNTNAAEATLTIQHEKSGESKQVRVTTRSATIEEL